MRRTAAGASANRLYELRTARGLTMADLAQAIGTTPGQIWKLEKGRVRLTVDWMARLAPALHCRPVDLLFDAPPSATHINTEILASAIRVAQAVLDGDPLIMVEMIAAVYDVLIEIAQERGIIDEGTIDTLIRTHRRARSPGTE